MPTAQVSSNTFCDFHGVDNYTRFVINKKFASLGNKTYEEWHELLKDQVQLGKVKDFTAPPTQQPPSPAPAPTGSTSTDNTKK